LRLLLHPHPAHRRDHASHRRQGVREDEVRGRAGQHLTRPRGERRRFGRSAGGRADLCRGSRCLRGGTKGVSQAPRTGERRPRTAYRQCLHRDPRQDGDNGGRRPAGRTAGRATEESRQPVGETYGPENCVATVTGASRGIGRWVARTLAERGYVVAANDLEAPEDTLKQIENTGGTGISVPGNVSDEASVRRMVEAMVGELERVDVFVNNAGVSLITAAEETTSAESP